MICPFFFSDFFIVVNKSYFYKVVQFVNISIINFLKKKVNEKVIFVFQRAFSNIKSHGKIKR